ncbi:MAG: helix-turn-helix transcriptional regulator [Treponema sp.]|nr:helix-turn-helix transcriptional regulator [Treponema sp.]
MKILKQNGYTQSRLAQELGVTQQYISMILSGRKMSLKTETKIAQVFSMSRNDMFCSFTREELYSMRIKELLKSKSKNKELVEEEIERLEREVDMWKYNKKM